MAVFLMFVLLGFVFVAKGINLLMLGNKSVHWDEYQGEITDALQVVEQGGSANQQQRFDHLMITYSYSINGDKFESNRVRFKWTKKNRFEEQEKYHQGKQISVFVNPENPKQSVLEPGVDASNYMAIFAGLFFVCSGILLALFIEV